MVDTKRFFRVGLLAYSNELSRIAQDFARKVEDCESIISPSAMSDCQFAYARIQQCSGLLTDILSLVCPVNFSGFQEDEVVREWRVVDGEFVPVFSADNIIVEDEDGQC